jgi:xanthine dehydrogenase YagS FAD-binding subunit
MKPFDYVTAKSAGEAAKLLAEGGKECRLKASGIDLLDEMKAYVATPSRLVNLRGAKGLDAIADHKDGTRIGALVTLAKLGEAFRDGALGVLGAAAREAATPQIRNVATVGGNLCQRPRCWYYRLADVPCRKKGGTDCPAIAGDNRYHAVFDTGTCPIAHPSNLATALVALDASVRLVGPKGERTVGIATFFSTADVTRENVLAADEVLVEVVVPPKWGQAKGAYLEGREKESFDWALVSCAAVLDVRGGECRAASVVLGGVAPVPRRAVEAEKALVGRAVDEAAAAEAAKAAFAGAAPLSMNGYKVPLGIAIAKRAILAAAKG